MRLSVQRFLALLVCVFLHHVVAMDDEMVELMKMLRENCVEETGVDVGLINKVNAGADLMPDSKLKCYCKCVMETAGMMSGGVIEVEAILAMLPPELKDHNEESIKKCGTQKGGDDCETAFNTQVCWQKSNKKDYMLV